MREAAMLAEALIGGALDPIMSIPAILIGILVRPPYVHLALPIWAVAIVSLNVNLAKQMQLVPSGISVLAWFFSPLIIGYVAALIVWFFRRRANSD